jgi:glycosyltransferase involved in cell wall biosynthesis
MITIVIPTRDRGHTLNLVAQSYFSQELVTEVIFVNDGGTDDTDNIISKNAKEYPYLNVKIIHNKTRLGASQSRNIGASKASNKYILFCDDDEYMGARYAATCFKLLTTLNAGAISGRRIYLQEKETQEQAAARFGKGMRSVKFFNPLVCEYINGAIINGNLKVPFTNANILTRLNLILKYPFDSYYNRGNGYREETDYQMNLYVNGFDIFVTNDCHTFHLPMSSVLTGGQRVSRMSRVYWSIFYTKYFFSKYYSKYAQRYGSRIPKSGALLMFCFFALYREFLRPTLYRVVMNVRTYCINNQLA